jgi:hypothetical protein
MTSDTDRDFAANTDFHQNDRTPKDTPKADKCRPCGLQGKRHFVPYSHARQMFR